MKIYKTLRKRGLALFMALTMCLSLIQTTAFAAEETDHVHNADGWICTQAEPAAELVCGKHVHSEDCYQQVQGELTCETAEHQHGEGCYAAAEPVLECGQAEHTHGDGCHNEEGVLVCETEEHTHDGGCYTEGEPALICEIPEHTHGEDCYAVETVKVCGEEDHEHTGECCTVTEGEWTCVPPEEEDVVNVLPEDLFEVVDLSEDEEGIVIDLTDPEDLPEPVLAFFDAVAALEGMTELTEENYMLLADAMDHYEALSDSGYDEYPGVYAAAVRMNEVLEGFGYGMDLMGYYNNLNASDLKATPDHYAPNNRIGSGLRRHYANSVTKEVGASGIAAMTNYLYFRCPHCGYTFRTVGAYAAYACNAQVESIVSYDKSGNQINDPVVQVDGFSIATLSGIDAVQTNFTALREGTAEVTVSYYVNFAYPGYWAPNLACMNCRGFVSVGADYTWHKYTDTFTVEVGEGPEDDDPDYNYTNEIWVYVPVSDEEGDIAHLELDKWSVYYPGGDYIYPQTWNISSFEMEKSKNTSEYADVTAVPKRDVDDWVLDSVWATGEHNYIDLSIQGLKETPEAQPATVYLAWYQQCKGYTRQTVIAKVNIVVYEPLPST